MKNVIRNLRAAIQNPEDYIARSNLMWDATMQKTGSSRWASAATLSATTWSTSWVAYTTATTAAAWRYSTRSTTAYLQGRAAQVRSLC